VSTLEWLLGISPSAKMDRLPAGAIQRVGGGNWQIINTGAGPGLPAVTEQAAQNVSAINACVKLLSGAVSSLPMNLYTMDFKTGAKSQVWGDDLWWVLNEQFDPQWPAAAGWDHIMRSRLFHGDAYATISRNRAGEVISIKPVSKSRVVTYQLETGRLVYAIYPEAKSVNVEVEYYDQDDMIHVPGDGFDGITSPSVLQFELRGAGAVALAAQDHMGRFFANGMMPGVVITSPEKPSPEQAQFNLDQVKDRYGGVKNAFVPMLLYGGADAKELTITPQDAEMLSSRKFQVEEIARIYGVPPFMIGHSEKTTSWGKGVEAMGSGFVRYTLRKHLHAITNEFNRKLFRRGNKFCEFDTSDLERPSFKEFIEALRSAVGRSGERPIMTQNEARARFNLPPVDGGDDVGTISATQGVIEEEANGDE
jgi:HK97 family phage portal protein